MDDTIPPPPPNMDFFWSLIDQTIGDDVDRKEQVEDLRTLASRMDREAIISLQSDLIRAVNDIRTSEMFDIAGLVNQSCSDDGFFYFLMWVVTLGRRANEEIFDDHEEIVKYLPDPRLGETHFGLELDTVLSGVYEATFGEDMPMIDHAYEEWGSSDISEPEEYEEAYPRVYAWAQARDRVNPRLSRGGFRDTITRD